jgi:hypothetical protein
LAILLYDVFHRFSFGSARRLWTRTSSGSRRLHPGRA